MLQHDFEPGSHRCTAFKPLSVYDRRFTGRYVAWNVFPKVRATHGSFQLNAPGRFNTERFELNLN